MFSGILDDDPVSSVWYFQVGNPVNAGLLRVAEPNNPIITKLRLDFQMHCEMMRGETRSTRQPMLIRFGYSSGVAS